MRIVRIIKEIIIPRPVVLGRWKNHSSDREKHINFVLANTDHCGDKICGKPQVTKQFLEK